MDSNLAIDRMAAYGKRYPTCLGHHSKRQSDDTGKMGF